MSPDEDTPVEQFPELTPFEAALAALAPRAAGMDRETLFFQAGQAAALRDLDHRRWDHRSSPWVRWAWPAAFSAMTALAATLLVMLCLRPGPMPGERRVPDTFAEQLPSLAAPDHKSQPEIRPNDISSYFRLRAAIFEHGLDALPAERVAAIDPGHVSAGPQEYRKLLTEALQD